MGDFSVVEENPDFISNENRICITFKAQSERSENASESSCSFRRIFAKRLQTVSIIRFPRRDTISTEIVSKTDGTEELLDSVII